MVLPDQLAVPRAHEAFDEQGNLKEERQQEGVLAIGAKLARVTEALAGA